jgi:RimJ/RimL family protein N-acetyltransferase
MDKLIFDREPIHAWINQRSGLIWVADFCGIARQIDGRIVAAVGYDHHQDSSCSFHIATERGGLSHGLWHNMFDVPFRQWKYKVLLGIVQAGNARSLNIARRLGFQNFATLPDAHPSGSLEFWKMTAADWQNNEKNQSYVRRRQRSHSAQS